MAHFGTEAGQPYDDLHKIYNRIVVAVRMLILTYRGRDQGSSPQDRREWETSIGWVPAADDKIPAELDVLVLEIEKVCRPAIQEGFAAGLTAKPQIGN
jgi:hypothetical protein